MNVFYTSTNIYECASHLDDKRLNKMIVETAQLLSTAARHRLGPTVCDHAGIYKATHRNHPWAVWARDNPTNYDRLWNLLTAYLLEYQMRFNKTHATGNISFTLYQMRSQIWPKFEYLSERPEQTEMPKCFHPLVSRSLPICDGYRETLRLKWIFDIRKPTWTKRAKPGFAP